MKILRGLTEMGIVHEDKNYLEIKGKQIFYPSNVVISSGDTITVKGNKYDVIEFNPTLFALTAKRKAQIIQPADASYILFRLGIKSGSRVLESGIGSGVLSSYILWSIGSEGRLVSVDRDAESIELARSNLAKFFDLSNWNGVVDDVKEVSNIDEMDAVFLDIPDPYDAVDNVKRFLRNGGMLATYSPTFNQTERTVIQMKKSNMVVLETTEIIKRDILVREGSTRPDHNVIWHTAFLTFAVKRSNYEIEI